jgi:transposase
MNSHKNARLTYVRRLEMVRDITQRGLSVPQAACALGVSAPTAPKWLGRYHANGEPGLSDVSSRPQRLPRSIEPAKALAIAELRHKRLSQARTAAALNVSKSTVRRVLARAGLSLLSITVSRLLTDNGSAQRSDQETSPRPARSLASGIASRGPTGPRPMARQSAIQSALREWAYGFTYQRSAERTASPLSASTAMCAFMPKCHCLP